MYAKRAAVRDEGADALITVVADLLQSFVGDELRIMDAHPITHGPTIGDMYEGLSEKVLARAIPRDLGVKVVTGFATNGSGAISKQIDRMLVVGAGEQIPNTDAFLWPAENVIAAIEVKKNLVPKEIAKAIANLTSFRDIEQPALNDLPKMPDWYDHERLVRCVGQVTRTQIHSLDWVDYDVTTRMIGAALFVDQLTALRVVLGFHGHKTEHGFRSALAKVLFEELQSSAKFVNLPHLIIGGRFSLAKSNGRPYYAASAGDGSWIPYFTTPANPLMVLLEMIWTRLDERFGLGDPWGEDLTTEVARRFIKATPLVVDDKDTWDLQFIVGTASDLNSTPISQPWEPVEVTLEEATALVLMATDGALGREDSSLVEMSARMGVSPAEFIEQLLATGLVSEGPAGIVLHTKQLVTAHLPDGRIVAADDPTGRLARWASAR